MLVAALSTLSATCIYRHAMLPFCRCRRRRSTENQVRISSRVGACETANEPESFSVVLFNPGFSCYHATPGRCDAADSVCLEIVIVTCNTHRIAAQCMVWRFRAIERRSITTSWSCVLDTVSQCGLEHEIPSSSDKRW